MPRNLFHDDDNDLVTRLSHPHHHDDRHHDDRHHDDLSALAVDSEPDRPPEGERWSSWDGASHGLARVRGEDGDLLAGTDLVPALAAALAHTLE